jgi:HEAT repeat protein
LDAIRVIGEIGHDAAEAAPQLAAIIQTDQDGIARSVAVMALAKIKPGASIARPAFLRALADRDRHVRQSAVFGLANLQPPDASVVPDLARIALGDPEAYLRAAAIDAASKISPKAAVTMARKALTDPQEQVRASAARALGSAGAAEAVADLSMVVSKDADEYVRQCAVTALGQIGSAARSAVPAILGVLKSTNSFSRSNAANALLSIVPNDSNSANALIAALDDDDKYVRKASLRTLAAMGPVAQAAIPALVQKVNGKDFEDQLLAIEALGSVGPANPSQAVPALLSVIEQGELGSRGEAFSALKRFDPIPDSAIPVLMKQLELNEEPFGANFQAAAVLGKAGRKVLPTLLTALKGQSEPSRYGAALALKYMGPQARDAQSALTSALSDPSERVRRAAADALAAMK